MEPRTPSTNQCTSGVTGFAGGADGRRSAAVACTLSGLNGRRVLRPPGPLEQDVERTAQAREGGEPGEHHEEPGTDARTDLLEVALVVGLPLLRPLGREDPDEERNRADADREPDDQRVADHGRQVRSATANLRLPGGVGAGESDHCRQHDGDDRDHGDVPALQRGASAGPDGVLTALAARLRLRVSTLAGCCLNRRSHQRRGAARRRASAPRPL